MKSFPFSAVALFLAVNSAAAQNSTTPTSTIMIKPGCPSAAPADVVVTRSAVAVPSCAAGNATKPAIVSMSTSAGGAASPSGSNPAQFTGAADSVRVGGVMVIIGGVVAGLMF